MASALGRHDRHSEQENGAGMVQATAACDELIKEIMETVSLSKKQMKRYGNRNLHGLEVFQSCKVAA
ncbi:MAG: hypothetical protein LBS03_04455 [Bacteroidales bacterium]|jgi:hypothetical protein|nr:hypothetical protein [Bacteroidales bacterium]